MQNADIKMGGDKFVTGGVSKKEATEEIKKIIERQNSKGKKQKKSDKAVTIPEEVKTAVQEELAAAEIMPMGSNLLVSPYPINPYAQMQITSEGVVVATDTVSKKKNTDTGEMEDQEEFIIVAKVQEVGPDVKNVIVGDDVYFTKPSYTPVPFLKMGMYVVPEQRVLVVVNSNIKERWTNK